MDIVFVQDDEWQGVYVNGNLYHEGSFIRWRAFVESLVGYTINSYSEIHIEGTWLVDYGNLPETLSELKRLEDIK